LKSEEDEHAKSGIEPQWTTTNSVNAESSSDSTEQVPNLKNTVDKILGYRVSNTNRDKNLLKIVRDKTVTGPLGEETNGKSNEGTSAVTAGSPKFSIRSLSDFLFLKNGLSNFTVFQLNKVIILITVGVELGKDTKSFLITTLADEPTGRFFIEPDREKLNDRGESLNEGRNSPGPFALDLQGTEGSPSSNNYEESGY
jgi:hypothetical protein